MLLFFKEQQEQISYGRSLKRAILRERAKSEEQILNPDTVYVVKFFWYFDDIFLCKTKDRIRIWVVN